MPPQGTPEGTKRAILQMLLREELKPSEMAGRLGITPTAVRQHLSALTALGLVERRRVATGPSRPPEIYRLSAEGRRVFPKRYDLLLAGVIEVMLERAGPERTFETVAEAARRLADGLKVLKDLPERERWTRLLAWLDHEFAWEADAAGWNGGPGRLIIHQCPFQDVSSRHPGVCGAFFSTLIQAMHPGVRLAHAPNAPGEACCQFVVTSGGAGSGEKEAGSRRRA
jgi:predicted ArsR family transcriptional regulator